MGNKLLTIVIPAYNESANITNTLESLYYQYDTSNELYPREHYQIVLVNNCSTDNTIELVNNYAKNHKDLKIDVINEGIKGVVHARIAGYNYVLNDPYITTLYLASSDADTLFHKNWVYNLINTFQNTHADMISCPGCFPDSFWAKVPNLAERYTNQIGTIFFNPDTIKNFKLNGKKFKFTEQIFIDFIRPVSDACFGITSSAYKRVGGYTCEYDNKGKEILFEGWRLMYKIERNNLNLVYMPSSPYETSPRRLLEEPEKFFSGLSYDVDFIDYRNTDENLYKRLNNIANKVDLTDVIERNVSFYILMRCITKTDLIDKNKYYFGDMAEEIRDTINNWWAENPIRQGCEVYDFSRKLGKTYSRAIYELMPYSTIN